MYTKKVCKTCKEEKDVSEFWIKRQYPTYTYYSFDCKGCSRKTTPKEVLLVEVIENEVWKPIIGYEGLYEISNIGRVKSLNKVRVNGVWYNEKIIRPKPNKDIYHRVELSKNGKRRIIGVHQLIGWSFIPNPENKPNINHKNGIRNDNRVENLEWCTQKENIQHAWRTGLSKSRKGGCHQSSKAILIIDFLKNSVTSIGSLKAGAKYLGIGHSTICRYASGQVKNDRYKFEYI